MLNYTSKGINTIVIFISIFLTIILFIFLDISIINSKYNEESANTVIGRYEKETNAAIIKINNRENINAIKLTDTMQEFMQIADIYENINELEDKNDNILNDISKSKWRIEIPKISLIAPIEEGTTQEVLGAAVGHFPESNKYNGNIALAGHNRGYNCNFFEKIKELKIGDEIIYYTEKGKKEYKVILNKIIHQTDWSYIESTSDNRITLITCVENMYEYRRCIQAVENI